MQTLINIPVKIPFTSVALATGLTVFTPRFLLEGITWVATPVTYTEIGGGLYTINFTPTSVGNLSIFVEGVLLPSIEVVSRSTSSILQNLEDESLGSWTWDKVTGKLEVLRQNGSSLAKFNVVDNISNASRERL